MSTKASRRSFNFFEFFVIFSIPFLFLVQEVYSFAAILIILLIYACVNFEDCFSINVLLIAGLFTVSFIPVLLISQHNYSHFFYYLMTISCLLAARGVSRAGVVRLFPIFQALFWFFVLFSLLVYYYYRDLAEPFSGLVKGSSTNGIPSYLIVIQVVYSLSFYCVKRHLPIVSVLFTLLVAILGIGRGSIYIALVILLISLFLNFFIDVKRRRYGWIVLYLLVLLSGVLLLIANIELLVDYLNAKTKALQGLSDPYREQILLEYLSSIKWWQVYLGGRYDGSVVETLYNGNPHIAFIRSHAYLGVFYTILVLLSPLYFVFFSRVAFSSGVFFLFSSILLVRALSEPILFPTALDFFYFLLFFLYYQSFYSKNYLVGSR